MKTHIPGFPRIGAGRELKKALESFWKGDISERKLHDTAKQIRLGNWQTQKTSGLSFVCVNDFSFYDYVLDTAFMLGLVRDRFKSNNPIETYFNMARGNAEKGIRPLSMKKWFDTNYHYLVPELDSHSEVRLNPTKPLLEAKEAVESGFEAKAVLLGPITFLSLAQAENLDKWTLLDSMVSAYIKLINELSAYCEWIEIDEPILACDLEDDIKKLFVDAHKKIKMAVKPKLILASHYGDAEENALLVFETGYDAFHTDIVRTKDLSFIKKMPAGMALSAGIIDGRNIWKTDLRKAYSTAQEIISAIGQENLMISSSSSLLHVPVDLALETELKTEVKDCLSFAVQKCSEISLLAKALEQKHISLLPESAFNAVSKTSVKYSDAMLKRKSTIEKRKQIQQKALNLPLLPTTTIGSFPQTKEIRERRNAFRKGLIDKNQYETFMKKEIENVIKLQNDLGIDVLVHGEPERTDMVEYFAEHLNGFAITKNGWVQSYGSRCVKPPVIYGDVSRSEPITVKWYQYAQSLTDKYVKGMLTGPVTIFQWSFARTDIPKKDVFAQIALAMRDEVIDLQKSGCKIIQIDEAAFREGLPLRKKEHEAYLKAAVDSFLLTSTGVEDETQIHTHMCYSEFNSIIEHIAAMDADVISIESSRSGMELLEVFKSFNYKGDIGPGVYDIHSPRVPSAQEIESLIFLALKYLKPEQLWINPDCGLKTRNNAEVVPSLENMMKAALKIRKELKG